MKIIWCMFALMPGTLQVATGQISPGKLTAVHSHMEGLSNCTNCHTLGNKVTSDKCLNCHTELKSRIAQHKGYHASLDVRGKPCTQCHSDHHGVNFQIIRFDKEKFNHQLTGYPLSGAHAKKTCPDCHKKEFITDAAIRKKRFSYLGLSTSCSSCHADYHQQTLGSTCNNCHGEERFKPAIRFDHGKTSYPLKGSHQHVACNQCHPVSLRNGEKFQEFKGIDFANCNSCHADVHQGRFGLNCSQCHTEVSFQTIKGYDRFDHSKTRFPLYDKHTTVPCASCHKGGISVKLNHDRCTDCHSDYHGGQFVQQGIVQDCKACHSTAGFEATSFTLEQHNASVFPLKGGHAATPCFACHRKQEKWSFRQIGIRCADCHNDPHASLITPDYYPGQSCETCHDPAGWSTVTFDHLLTGYALTGSHSKASCRSCHFRTGPEGKAIQQFQTLSGACGNCHSSPHQGQFGPDPGVACQQCHDQSSGLWKIAAFNHDQTAFRLDGRHREVPCSRCHPAVTRDQISYVLYKTGKSKCEHCH